MNATSHHEMPNPYSKISLHRLYLACHRRAVDLIRESDACSERRSDRDTARLLIAATERFDFTLTPQRPALQLARGREFCEVFDEFHRSSLRDARYRTIVAAATAVHGDRASEWLRTARIDGEHVNEFALKSDLGMSAAIAHLGGQYIAKRKATGLPRASSREY